MRSNTIAYVLLLLIRQDLIGATQPLLLLGGAQKRTKPSPSPSSIPTFNPAQLLPTKQTLQRITNTHRPFLFLPNLIGYLRIALLVVALKSALVKPGRTLIAYMLSFSLDVVDGVAARWLNQVSNLGGLLDMLTDRMATLGVLFVLSHIYPSRFLPVFIFFGALDVSSHWARTIESAKKGKHHKSEGERNKILHPMLTRFNLVNHYYNNYKFFAYCCVSAELFWLCAYWLAFSDGELVRKLMVGVFGIGWAVKQLTNAQQLVVSAAGLD